MLPFQTDSFDPGDPELIQRVGRGERLTWLYLGATAYRVAGERWLIMSADGCGATWLAYPLPEAYGEAPEGAMTAFLNAWRPELARLRREGGGAVPGVQLPAAVTGRLGRLPTVKRVALAGAVPLPGLEPWTGYGRG